MTTYLTAEWFRDEATRLEAVADLHTQGVNYHTACAAVFSGDTSTPAARTAWITAVVRAQLTEMVERLPWLGGAA